MSWENAYRPYNPQPESSGKALASLILGIAGLIVCPLVCSVLAIVFATQARAEIAESRGRIGGGQNAQVGLILGWVGVAIGAIEAVVLLMFLYAAS
ncbi:DUF4190 domain-containing protein [Solirubrobacter soli]|uniref:DUF4190 domain-containing protein n=1 Tax=Solirubrobacter soli TaxID=363832 RepID=UPI000414038F|nr:DUF4190 domain-containing protein [Solirubrobacter soli]